MAHFYRVRELAELTGVSARTLHHYDHIGLLRPSQRTAAGYRLYAEADLLRLQQILTLRFLGFSLAEIGELLAQPDFGLLGSLQLQRIALRQRMAQLQRMETLLGELAERRHATGAWDWELAARSAALTQAQMQGDGMKDVRELYTPEQLRKFEEWHEQLKPEDITAIERRWAALLAEVEASRQLDPASPQAQALADRWNALVAETFQGNQEMRELVGEHYRKGSFEGMPGTPQSADFAFIARVELARQGKGGGAA